MHTGLPSTCNIGLSMSLSAMKDVVNRWHNLKDLRKGTSVNRVQQIREHTVPEQWKYVEGKKNPADEASRGLSPNDLLQSSRSLHGPPSFL